MCMDIYDVNKVNYIVICIVNFGAMKNYFVNISFIEICKMWGDYVNNKSQKQYFLLKGW